MALNKECKREIIASVIYNLAYVLTLLILRYFNVFDLIGVQPEIEIFLWIVAIIGIIASIISVWISYSMLYGRK